MSGHRGQSRQNDKQKRKRAEVRKKQSLAKAALRPSALFKRATDFPITEAWLGAGWQTPSEDHPQVILAIVMRRCPGGSLIGTALLDLTCLGVKDAWSSMMGQIEADAWLRRVRQDMDLEKVDADTCLTMVHDAAQYAASLGFPPHPEFQEAMFSPRPADRGRAPLFKPSRPLYVAGPDDDVGAIIRKLRLVVGSDFRYVIPDAEGSGSVIDAADSMRMLNQMRRLRDATLLLQEGSLDEAEAVCDEMLGEEAETFDAMELKAGIREARGDYAGAMEWLRKALETAEGSSDDDLAGVREALERVAASMRENDAAPAPGADDTAGEETT